MGVQTSELPTALQDAIESRTLTAERVVLSVLMRDAANTFDVVKSTLQRGDFLSDFHAAVFSAIETCLSSGEPIEPAMLGEIAARTLPADDYPGIGYMRRLMAMGEDSSNAAAYAKVVLQHAVRRQLLQKNAEQQKRFKRCTEDDLEEMIATAQDDLEQLEQRLSSRRPQTFESLGTYTQKALDQIQEALAMNCPDGVIGVRTGYVDLDRTLLGLQRGDLVVLAARPSMGKTGLAMNIAENVATLEQLPVLVFSLEMSGEALALRFMSARTGIEGRRLRSAQLEDHEWSGVLDAMDAAAGAQEWIETKSAVHTREIMRRGREIEAKTGKRLGLIVVDYLQLMQSTEGDGKDPRAQQVASITRGLKEVAKALNAPVLALSQLNRSVEMRPDKRPMMSDLRESGAIEQDADVVLFVYRDEYYNPDTPKPGIAEIIIGKQRNGPIGMVELRMNKDTSRFENIGTT